MEEIDALRIEFQKEIEANHLQVVGNLKRRFHDLFDILKNMDERITALEHNEEV